MVDGTATVRFYSNEFNESGNIVTVVTPGTGDYLTSDQNKNVRTFNVDDKSIPGEVIRSKLIVSDLTTYPNSNMDYTVTLMDINNNAIANEPVLISIGSKSFNSVISFVSKVKSSDLISFSKLVAKLYLKVSNNAFVSISSLFNDLI